MRGFRLLGPALAGVALLASALPAQRAPLRSGLWFELGRGTGNIRISCTTCERPTSLFGGSGFLRIGGSLSRKVLLSLEVFSLLDDRFEARGTDSTVTLETYAVGPTVLWYPWSSGFHLSAGMGVAGVELALPVTEDVPELLASGTGVGVHFGVGLDVPLWRKLSTSASFGVYYSAIGDVPITENVVDDVISTGYHVSIALVLR